MIYFYAKTLCLFKRSHTHRTFTLYLILAANKFLYSDVVENRKEERVREKSAREARNKQIGT